MAYPLPSPPSFTRAQLPTQQPATEAEQLSVRAGNAWWDLRDHVVSYPFLALNDAAEEYGLTPAQLLTVVVARRRLYNLFVAALHAILFRHGLYPIIMRHREALSDLRNPERAADFDVTHANVTIARVRYANTYSEWSRAESFYPRSERHPPFVAWDHYRLLTFFQYQAEHGILPDVFYALGVEAVPHLLSNFGHPWDRDGFRDFPSDDDLLPPPDLPEPPNLLSHFWDLFNDELEDGMFDHPVETPEHDAIALHAAIAALAERTANGTSLRDFLRPSTTFSARGDLTELETAVSDFNHAWEEWEIFRLDHWCFNANAHEQGRAWRSAVSPVFAAIARIEYAAGFTHQMGVARERQLRLQQSTVQPSLEELDDARRAFDDACVRARRMRAETLQMDNPFLVSEERLILALAWGSTQHTPSSPPLLSPHEAVIELASYRLALRQLMDYTPIGSEVLAVEIAVRNPPHGYLRTLEVAVPTLDSNARGNALYDRPLSPDGPWGNWPEHSDDDEETAAVLAAAGWGAPPSPDIVGWD